MAEDQLTEELPPEHDLLTGLNRLLAQEQKLTYNEAAHALAVLNAIAGAEQQPFEKRIETLLRVSEIPGERDIGTQLAQRIIEIGPQERLDDLLEVPRLGPKTLANLIKQLSRIEITDALWHSEVEHAVEIEPVPAEPIPVEAEPTSSEPHSEVLHDALNAQLSKDGLGTIDYPALDNALAHFNTLNNQDIPLAHRLRALLVGTEIPELRDIGPTLGSRLLASGTVSSLETLAEIEGMNFPMFARLVWALNQMDPLQVLEETANKPEETTEAPIEETPILEFPESNIIEGYFEGEPEIVFGNTNTYLETTNAGESDTRVLNTHAGYPHLIEEEEETSTLLMPPTLTQRFPDQGLLDVLPEDLSHAVLLGALPTYTVLKETPVASGGVNIIDLPRLAGWWGAVEDTAENDAPLQNKTEDTPEEEQPRDVAPPLIPLEAPDEDEEDILDEIAEELRKRLEDEKERQRKELEKKRKRLERLKERARKLREQRDRDPEKRDRDRRNRDQRNRRKDLNKRRSDQEAERNRNKGERKGLENDRERLKEDERDARRGPPADPNCRGAHCRNIQQQREQVNRDLTRNMQDGQQLERDGRDLRNAERDWQRDQQQLQNDLDRGYGMDKGEYKEHRQRRKIQRMQQEIDARDRRLDELKELDAERELSPKESRELRNIERELEREQRNFEKYEKYNHLDPNAAQSPRELLVQEELNKLRDITNANFPDGSGSGNDGLEQRALDQLTDAELLDFENTLQNATDSLQDTINKLDQGEEFKPVPEAARNAFDQAMERFEDLQDLERSHQSSVEGFHDGLNNMRERRAEIRKRLRSLGNNMNGTVHGSEDEVREVENLRQEYRALQNAEIGQAEALNRARSRLQVTSDQVGEQQRAVQRATTAKVAEEGRSDTFDLQQRWRPILQANGKLTANARQSTLNNVRDLRQWEGLNQRADGLRKALGVDRAKLPTEHPRARLPSEAQLKRELADVSGKLSVVESRLKQVGIVRSGKGFTNEANSVTAYSTLSGIKNWAEQRRRKLAQEKNALRVKAAQQARNLPERAQNIRRLEQVDKQLQSRQNTSNKNGEGGVLATLAGARRGQLAVNLRQLKAAQSQEALGPVNRMLSNILNATEAGRAGPIFEALVDSLGLTRMRQFALEQAKLNETTQALDLLRNLFVTRLMSESINAGRYTEAVRHNDRYVAALTDLRDRMPPEERDSKAYERIHLALISARQNLAENYRRLAKRYERIGQVTEALNFRTLANTFSQVEKRQRETIYFLGNEIEKLFKQSDALLGEALLVGDIERAIRISESRLAQANLFLDEAVRNDNGFIGKFKQHIAEEFERLAELYRMQVKATTDPKLRAQWEKRSARSELMAATYYGFDWRERAFQAVSRVDHESHPEFRAWKERLLAQAISSLPPAENIAADSYLHGLRLQMLQALHDTSTRTEVKADALTLRAQELHRQGKNTEALNEAKAGWKLRQNGAIQAVTYLTLLLQEETPSKDEVFAVLATVPAEHAERYDQLAMMKFMLRDPTSAALEALKATIENNSFTPARSANLGILVNSSLIRRYVEEGNNNARIAALVQETKNLLPQSNFDDKKQEKIAKELDALAQSSTQFERFYNAFNAGTLPAEQLFDFFVTALLLDKTDVANTALQHYIASEEIDAATKLLSLAGLFAGFEKQLADPKTSDESKTRMQGWMAMIRPQAENLGTNEIAEYSAELEHMHGVVREAEADLKRIDVTIPNWRDGAMWAVSLGSHPIFQSQKEKRKAISILSGRLQNFGHRIMEIQRARAAFAVAGRSGTERASALAAERRKADQLFAEAHSRAWRDAKLTSNIISAETSFRQLDKHLAALEAAERMQEGVSWIEIEEAQRKIKESGGVLKTAAQFELERLQRKRLGRDGTSRFDDNEMGERKKFLNFKSWKGWYDLQDNSNQYQWKYDLLQARVRRTEERIMRLIRSGPMVNPKDGKPISLGARKAVEVELLLSEQKQLQRRYQRYQSIPLFELAGLGTQEQQRMGLIKYQMQYDPSYRAVRTLGLDNYQISDSDYYAALSHAYTAIAYDHATALAEYANEDWYSRGIVHTFRLVVSPYFTDSDSIGFGGDLARLQSYQKEAYTLSDALWQLSRKPGAKASALSLSQQNILEKFGFIKNNDDGSQSVVPPWQAEVLHRDLNLPQPTLVDEIFNPKNIVHLIGTVMLPGGAAMVGSRMLVSLEGLVGGTIVRAALDAALFTALSYPAQYYFASEDQREKMNVFGTLAENYAMFLVLGSVGKIAEAFPEAKALFNNKEWVKRALYVGGGKTLRLSTEAAIMSGVEVLTTGEDFSARMFLRHLLTIGFLHAGNHLAIKGIKKGADVYQKWKYREPEISRPQVDPVRAAEIDAQFRPLEEHLTADRTQVENIFVNSPDRAAIEAAARDLGVMIVEVPTLPENVRAQVNASPDGRPIIFVDAKSSKLDLFNELTKVKRMQLYEINARTGINAHEIALLEYESYQAEVELLRNQPATDRANLALTLRDFWLQRLRSIETGKLNNHPVARPFEGFSLDIGYDRGEVLYWFEGYVKLLEIKPDFASDARLANLEQLARKYVENRQQTAMRRVDELHQKLGKIADNNLEISRLQREYLDHRDAILELRAKNEKLVAELETLENKITKAIRDASDIALGVRELGRPDIFADYSSEPVYREKWTDADRQGFLKSYINDYVALWRNNKTLRAQELAAKKSGNTTLEKQLHEQINVQQAEMVNISKTLGGDAAIGPDLISVESGAVERALQRKFKGQKVEVLFMEEAGGGGSGELDLVLRVDKKVVVVEIKGGSSELGSAESGGFNLRLEQGTLAYILEIALKMDQRATRLIAEGKTVAGENMRKTADEVFQGYRDGALESYVVKTKWVPQGSNDLTIKSTDIRRVHLRWTRDGQALSAADRGIPIEYPEGPARSDQFRAGMVRLPTANEVRAQSDGVNATLPESMNQLQKAITEAAHAGENTNLIVLPEAAVVIERKGNAPIEQLVHDPALAPLQKLAVNLNRNILGGVMWVIDGVSPRGAAVLFRADGQIQFIDWSAHNSGTAGRLKIPTPAGEIEIGASVCADSSSAMAHKDIHVVVARCRPERLAKFLQPFPRGIGINWSGKNFADRPLIYFEDLPMVAPEVPPF